VQGAYLYAQLQSIFCTSHTFHNHKNQFVIKPKVVLLPIQLGIFMLNHKGPFILKGATGAKVKVPTKDYILHMSYMD
jgi:hypothetical protein